MPKKIVITGMSRSGTHFSKYFFQSFGLKSSHEKVFDCAMTLKDIDLKNYNGYDVCVSYVAAPFLKHVPDNAIVVHQVRNPLKAIRTIHSTNNYFNYKRTTSLSFFNRHAPEAWEREQEDHVQLCAYLWYYWNKMIEDSGRVEIFHQIEEPKFKEIFDLAGYDIPVEKVNAVHGVMKSQGKPNSKTPPRTPHLSWDDLPQEVREMGERYGYK